MEARLKRLDEASFFGDVNKLKVLLDEDQLLFDRMFTSTSSKDNPLHVAAHLGHAAFTRKIVQLKPELATQLNEEGQSPLHLAVGHGHISVVKELLLLEARFDLRVIQENRNGLTPIHVAVTKGSMQMIEELATNASVAAMSTPSYKGETLLQLSVKNNRLDAVKYFSETQKDKLTAADHDGNTALHLAMTGAQLPVITHLLSCEAIKNDINPRNNLGFTPLDVLSLSSHDKSTALTVTVMIINGGGKYGHELRGTSGPSPNTSTLATVTSPACPNKQITRTRGILSGEGDNNNDAGVLIVVATLVATITFQAGLNPPGGTIQMPYEKGDTHRLDGLTYYNTTWFSNWEVPYPAGLPVLFWSLKTFSVLNTVSLLLSVSIILLLLSGVPQKSRFTMKLLALLMWLAVFCTLLAFLSFFNDPFWGFYKSIAFENKVLSLQYILDYIASYTKTWYAAANYIRLGIFGVGTLWISIRTIIILLRGGGIKGEPQWINKIRKLVKKIKRGIWPNKVVCIMLIICTVVILVLVNVWMYNWFYNFAD